MASAAHSSDAPTRFGNESGDLFNSPLVWFTLVLMALFTVATLATFVVIYYGDDVAVPSWNERAPAP